jgi:hypothetical protein
MSKPNELLESLPPAWVNRIFDKLTVTYGRDFIGRWDGMELSTVKADWAFELRGFKGRPEAIAYALENLPQGKPPTVIDFRAMCARRPDASMPVLPAPDPAGLLRIASSLAPVMNHQETPNEWMGRLERDVKDGNAGPGRIAHYRIAVQNGYFGNQAGPIVGSFSAPPKEVLPPGMRY